ncbi:MAG: hypothetical protein A2Y22_05685 [Clostridiales bacterium GWD2_32_59]|nr:MAG: hypothetical protein A2Y22_05685 [Clostridiales bacterium GWD2_32_59]
MEYYKNIESALEFIEENVKNDISLHDISKSAFLSPFHFHRIFSYVVGDTVMRYLNRRRLTHSLEELLTTNKSIIDISYEFRFESHETFLRSFKRYFGITPSSYRKNKKVINNYERQRFSTLILKKVKDGDYCMKRIIIIEVGSTNTKTYMAYEDGRIDILPLKYIPFKSNYTIETGFYQDDVDALKNHINSLKHKYNLEIKEYGTSIFRKITQEQKSKFKDEIEKHTGTSFEVISQEDENKYTTYGVISNIKNEVTVLITGGGSTELSKCINGSIISSHHIDYGIEDIIRNFKELSQDRTEIKLENVIKFIKQNVDIPMIDTNILVLAGGQHMMFSDIAKYPIEKNVFYDNINQKHMITSKDAYEYDEKLFNVYSLDKLKETTPDNKGWWDGARAARACIEAFIVGTNVEYIIPTDISMIYGLANENFCNYWYRYKS